MEVDEDDEPVVKRMNLNDAGHKNSMSMIADRVEVGQRLGKRYEDHNDGVTVYDRLGNEYMHSYKQQFYKKVYFF